MDIFILAMILWNGDIFYLKSKGYKEWLNDLTVIMVIVVIVVIMIN